MKKILSPRLAFTLVELLVVISIIAVLAGMTFTGVRGAMLAAKKVQAKNDMMQIANAVTSYYTEYGKYPSGSTTTATTDQTYGIKGANDNNMIINVLRCVSTGTNENTRQIKFIEPKVIEATKGCVQKSTGIWFDPWGTQYLIFEDLDYDDAITVSTMFDITDNPSFGVGTASVGLVYSNLGKTQSMAAKSDMPGTATVQGKKSLLLSWQ